MNVAFTLQKRKMESQRHLSVSGKEQKVQFTPPPPPPTANPHRRPIVPATCPKCGDPTICPCTCPKCGYPTICPCTSPSSSRVNLTPRVNPTPPNPRENVIAMPVPQSQTVAPRSDRDFEAPRKVIVSQDHIKRFQSSAAFGNFIGFVVALSESVRSRKLSDPCHVSPAISAVVSALQTLISFVDEIPPAPQSSRSGNKAYKKWHTRMRSNAESSMTQFLPPELHSSTIELVPYFTDSFGNADRIDYGTGHETHFAAWFYCLARLGVLKEEDYQALVSKVFVKYLELMRKLQSTYGLEPAGSHGVWGLDDYHFLPFIFGSSQLIDHKYIKPRSTRSEDILDNFSNEYLYLSCVASIMKLKKGKLAEHSRMLNDISRVPNWDTVNSGLLKMYKVEILQKLPIMQHFLFGSLIRWKY